MTPLARAVLVNTLRSAMMGGAKKDAAEPSASRTRSDGEGRPPVPGRIVRIGPVHLAWAVALGLTDDRVETRRDPGTAGAFLSANEIGALTLR